MGLVLKMAIELLSLAGGPAVPSVNRWPRCGPTNITACKAEVHLLLLS